MTSAIAVATPEKRLFVSLITRDITLADAILDLIDNSINAAMQNVDSKLDSAKAFHKFLTNSHVKPKATIRIDLSEAKIKIADDAGGIEFTTARDSVFRFGAAEGSHSNSDRLSVFGIGLKRAMFKIGNDINIKSQHKKGGFSLKLDAQKWEQTPQNVWGFDIVSLPKYSQNDAGTVIEIKELHDDVRRRVSDITFVAALRDKLAKTYCYFLGRLVQITLNGRQIDPVIFDIGGNVSHDKFDSGKVEYNITVGLRAGTRFTQDASGWFVFCNGRALVYADKSEQTGWGGEILPVFQPKHRPFLGLVFFYSSSPEELPWTTTKDSINQESAVWQDAKRHMGALARPVLKFLDERYSSESGEAQDVAELAGEKLTPLAASVSKRSAFKVPTATKEKTIRVQFDALPKEIKAVQKHLNASTMAAKKIGRIAFDYYLKNEVGTK